MSTKALTLTAVVFAVLAGVLAFKAPFAVAKPAAAILLVVGSVLAIHAAIGADKHEREEEGRVVSRKGRAA